MEYAYDLSGGSTAIIKRYQVAATNTVVGKPFLVPAGSGSGLVTATTTGTAKAVGVNVDTAGTYVTAQQSDNSDTERSCGIILSPLAVYRMLMSGGATEGTALGLSTAASGGSDGLTVVVDTNTDSPEMDEGTIFGYSGTNAGIARKITSNSTTTVTVTVAFPRDAVAGDTFLIVPYNPLQGVTLQLTTLLTQADASIAVGTGAAFKTVELELRDVAQEGRTNSYVYAVLSNHLFSATLADS
jgi:hypothetical protein